MHRRLLALLLALSVGVIPFVEASPVTASSDQSLTTTVAIGGVRESGGSFVSNADCGAGSISGFEYRCAFEFDISSLISSAKVTSATLSIRRTSGCATNDCKLDLLGYVGDGQATLGDLAVGTVVTSFTPTSSTRALDVTAQVQALVSDGDSWVGYRLSSSASATRTDPQAFDMTGANRVTLSLSYVSLPVDVIVHLAGLGDGTVTSNPAGIDCPGTCTWWFEYTEPVTLTASPQNGGSFSHWEGGDCDGSTNPICNFQAPATFFESTAFFDPIAPPVSQPPGATPTPAQLTPPPLPTAHASTGPLPTGAPARTTAPTGGPAPTLGPAPTDVIASDGTIITPPPPTLAPGATPAPTIVGLDGGAGDAATTGGVPLPLLIVLVLVLGGVVGGGVYWFTKRRQDAAPPPQA